MKAVRNVTFYCLLAWCLLVLVGCGKKADESKPLSEVKAEAEKMDVAKLRSMAMEYKNAIMAKRVEIDKVINKFKDLPTAQKIGDEAKEFKAEIEGLNNSMSALQQRFQIYYQKVKEKGGDLSGLKI